MRPTAFWRAHAHALLLPALAACAAGPRGTEAPAPARVVVEPPPIEAGVAPPPGPYAPGFDALHYEIALTLPDTGRYIRARSLARVRLVPGAVRPDTLRLDLTGLAVRDVRVDGLEAPFRQDAGKLRIAVPAGATPGDTLQVVVGYEGVPDDGLIIGPNVHGARTAFVDNWPNRARFWFPSIDHPSDKATVAYVVSAPEPWIVLANGVRIDAGAPPALEPPPAPEGGARRAIWRWATQAPIPTYTMVVGAAELATGRAGAACAPSDGRCIETTWWVFPQDTANARRIFGRADRMVEYFSDLIAPFPYEQLMHIQSSTRFGGMENVGAIFYDEKAIAGGTLSETTVAHETAHQWFGDAVTEADWHHLWLSEGFATYFAGLFLDHADGAAAFREYMERQRVRYTGSAVVDRPIVDPTERDLFALLNANNYPKGAWVLHTLRGVVGDPAFFEGIRRYYRAHEHGTAMTADLVAAMEAASGTELDWFFEQWVFRPGYPRLGVETRWDAARSELEVTVAQVQPESWPTFRLPITLEFAVPGGPVRRDVILDERVETIRVPLRAEPQGVVVDPEGWVLKEVVG